MKISTIGKMMILAAALSVASGCMRTGSSGGGKPGHYSPPAIDQKIRTSDRDDAIRVYSRGRSNNPKKVRVCLRSSASGKNKGLHWKLENKPRYVAKRKGETVCAEHPAGNRTVTWYLYKRVGVGGVGGWRAVGEYRLNVRGREGQKITFDWYRD